MKEASKLISCWECAFQGRVGADCSGKGEFELGRLRGQPSEKEETEKNEVSWSYWIGDKVPVKNNEKPPREKEAEFIIPSTRLYPLDSGSTYSIISQLFAEVLVLL